MKLAPASIAIILALPLSALPAYAQNEGGGRETSADRRREERRIERDRRANDEFNASQQFRVMQLDAMWDEFQANRARAAEYRPRLLVEETEKFAERIERLYSEGSSAELSERDLNNPSEEIEDSVGRLTQLVNYGSDPPQINVAPLPDEGVDVRVQRLVNISRRLIPNLLYLVGNDLFNFNLLNQIRDDLALTEALSRSLHGS
jgi:hypothetical protein